MAATHELVYCEDEADYSGLTELIQAQWPQAVFEDGSDYIHEHRFAVTIPDVTEGEFWKFAISSKFALCCLGFNLIKMSDPKTVFSVA